MLFAGASVCHFLGLFLNSRVVYVEDVKLSMCWIVLLEFVIFGL